MEELSGDTVDEPVQHTVKGQEGAERIIGAGLYGAHGEAELKCKVLLFGAVGGDGGEAG
jgi:hypothetical protein